MFVYQKIDFKDMKTICFFSLILCFSFWGCNNDDYSYGVDDYVSTSFIAKVEDSEEMQCYLESCSTLFSRIEDLNSKIEKEDLKELSELYLLCKSEPQVYKAMLEEKVAELYSSEDLASVKILYDKVLQDRDCVIDGEIFKSFSESEKSDLDDLVVFEMPIMRKQIFGKVVTRSKEEEAVCIHECNENYRWKLVVIASNTLCAVGVTIVIDCLTLGSATLPVLMAVLAEYAIMNSELADAQREFEMCKNDCIAIYGTN